MLRKIVKIICDSERAPAPSSQVGDWHDVTGHHRYYGSLASNGGERIVETRRGSRPQSSVMALLLNVEPNRVGLPWIAGMAIAIISIRERFFARRASWNTSFRGSPNGSALAPPDGAEPGISRFSARDSGFASFARAPE